MEKRIRIEQFEYEGFGHCGGFSTDGDGFYCEFSGESIPITKEICENKCPYDNSISRKEAIKKIEKHLIASTIKFNTTADVVAEIALNALLEGK